MKKLQALKCFNLIKRNFASKDMSPMANTAAALGLYRKNNTPFRKRLDGLIPDLVEKPAVPGELSALQGYPENYTKRKVQIFKRNEATQYGGFRETYWCLVYLVSSDHPTYVDGFTGNPSLTDPLSNLNLRFNDAESAIDYCVKYGIQYEVLEPSYKYPHVENDYGYNVLSLGVRDQLVKLGRKKGSKLWAYEKPYSDHWLNRYHTDYDVDEWKSEAK